MIAVQRAKQPKVSKDAKLVKPGLVFRSAKEYANYLGGGWWKSKRAHMLRKARFTCQQCSAFNVPLQVHHLHYRTLGREKDADLKVLCEQCHKDAHPDKNPLSTRLDQQLTARLVREQ